jgi:hypothetical protein
MNVLVFDRIKIVSSEKQCRMQRRRIGGEDSISCSIFIDNETHSIRLELVSIKRHSWRIFSWLHSNHHVGRSSCSYQWTREEEKRSLIFNQVFYSCSSKIHHIACRVMIFANVRQVIIVSLSLSWIPIFFSLNFYSSFLQWHIYRSMYIVRDSERDRERERDRYVYTMMKWFFGQQRVILLVFSQLICPFYSNHIGR